MNSNFDAAAAVQQIHDLGARVIGRLVVYKDTKLAQWAWNNDRRDMVTQTTGGEPFTGSYGEFAFTNPANPDVQQYNLDIAMEAAALGFDDILYDYIRRPDGALDAMVFPGIGDRTPEQAVVEVMATAYPLLREQGVWVGASVFGIAVTRPLEIAQDIPAMAPYLDYVSPMVYPNHWGPGEYGLSSPEDAPYEIVQQSLADFQEVLEPTGTVVMPWLQDFGGYGEAEVRAQIDATMDATGREWFLLWNSGANYTTAALDPDRSRGRLSRRLPSRPLQASSLLTTLAAMCETSRTPGSKSPRRRRPRMTTVAPADAVGRFDRDGYLFPLDAFRPDEVAPVAAQVMDFAANGVPGLTVPWHQKTYLLLPALDDLLRDPRLTGLVAPILGDDLLALSADVFVKPPRSTKRITWHQDVNFWDLAPWDMLTAWIALTPATAANGCMRYSPGGHRARIRHVERPSDDNMLSKGQELAVAVDEATAAMVELAPGQVSFHHALCPHASGPNHTDEPRIGFAIRYAATHVRQQAGPPITARLARGTDRHGNFRLEEGPEAPLDARARARHHAALAPHEATDYSTV